jgi:hypothetical protein
MAFVCELQVEMRCNKLRPTLQMQSSCSLLHVSFEHYSHLCSASKSPISTTDRWESFNFWLWVRSSDRKGLTKGRAWPSNWVLTCTLHGGIHERKVQRCTRQATFILSAERTTWSRNTKTWLDAWGRVELTESALADRRWKWILVWKAKYEDGRASILCKEHNWFDFVIKCSVHDSSFLSPHTQTDLTGNKSNFNRNWPDVDLTKFSWTYDWFVRHLTTLSSVVGEMRHVSITNRDYTRICNEKVIT